MLNYEIEYLLISECSIDLNFPDFDRNIENPQQKVSSSSLVYGRITGYFVCNEP